MVHGNRRRRHPRRTELQKLVDPYSLDGIARKRIRDILARHARKVGHGRRPNTIVRCTPARGGYTTGSDGKPIYDTPEAAQAAAVEFQLLGFPRMWVYPCSRSKSGHCHLTTKDPNGPRPALGDGAPTPIPESPD